MNRAHDVGFDDRIDGLFSELADILGADSTATLFAAFVGETIYIPRSPGPEHPITLSIGSEKAALLGDYFHGMEIYFPVAGVKRSRIVTMKQAGKSVKEITRTVLVSRSTVYSVLRECRYAEATARKTTLTAEAGVPRDPA